MPGRWVKSMVLAVCCVGAAVDACWAQKKWRQYEGCTLIEHPSNDGDSFHTRVNRRHYIFRLYWVDAPETDMSYPERVQAQADYFGIAPADVIRFGKEAARFTRDFLKEPYTVHSKLADARGNSERDRDYANVQVGDKFLHIELARAGLARIHGLMETSPNMPAEDFMRRRLQEAEREAKAAKRGAWSVGQGSGNTIAGERVLTRTVTVLDPENPSRTLGLLRAGAAVTILGAETPTLIKIRFKVGDEDREGLCQRAELGL